MSLLAGLLTAYLVGAIPASYLVARFAAGVDLRAAGSGNLGATNLYRVLGWRYAVPVGLFDIAKGAVPVLLLPAQMSAARWVPLAVGGAAIAGHVYSVFVGFRGGKGVATAAGVVLALAPAAVAVCAGIWAALVLATGYVSLASLAGALTFPLAAWLTTGGDLWLSGAGVLLALFIVSTHRANVRRLLAGTESRFGRRGAS